MYPRGRIHGPGRMENGFRNKECTAVAGRKWAASRWRDSRRPETQFPDAAARGDLAGSSVNEHIRRRRPRRKIWHRDTASARARFRPPPRAAAARIAATAPCTQFIQYGRLPFIKRRGAGARGAAEGTLSRRPAPRPTPVRNVPTNGTVVSSERSASAPGFPLKCV